MRRTDEERGRDVRRFTVKGRGDLASFLVTQGLSRTKVKQLIGHRAVEVNGRAAERPSHALFPGDSVTITSRPREREVPPPRGIEIVYEDDAILVASKPAGLLSIATAHERRRTAYYRINSYLRRRNPKAHERVFIVHRLDRDTSGLIVLAKNEPAKRSLQEGWRGAEKRYFAVVEGIPRKREGVIRSHLVETETFKVFSGKPSAGSKLAVTRYRVLRSGRSCSLLDILLETGRKHQIRVHLSDIDHPVLGDRKYGAETDPLGRLALHAYFLAFSHPVTGERMRFVTEIPPAFDALLREGRKAGGRPLTGRKEEGGFPGGNPPSQSGAFGSTGGAGRARPGGPSGPESPRTRQPHRR